MREDYFGERVAKHHDESEGEMFTPAGIEPAVSFLADLARDGAALELGIGTGRIALPLSQRGVRVHGIDLSASMVAKLRAKPGGELIDVTLGDFATTTVEGTFTLVYLVFNTIMNLTSQDEQVECFRNVAAHLQPGGYFVIEVGVPDLQRLPPGEIFRPFTVTATTLGFDEYDIANRPRLPSLSGRRPAAGPCLDSVPVRLAIGARSDGAPCGDETARALERLATRAVHERQHDARVGVGEDGVVIALRRWT